ncbi:MAG: DUF2332 domain-containing protein [Actinobacteria bacterium]|nr:MAG: DUF2332 domain-containing protein [Actinomycetota bacterium]
MPVTESSALPRAAAARVTGRSLPERFRRQADSLERAGRSPLCVRLMHDAARNIDARGVVAELYDGVSVPAGSVPALRLLGALHYLVLAGRARALAEFYPSAGGTRPPAGVWPVADAALREHFDWVRGRVGRTVQTNEPGRAAALFSALLWLTDRYRMPIRLLEVGASAGLNLLVDRFCYLVGDRALGDPTSPVRFLEPWSPPPDIDLLDAARSLQIAERSGCDVAPLDPASPEDRLLALSYIWPDEPERMDRIRAALELAAHDPPPIAAAPADTWLPAKLADRPADVLTVVWHSVFRQYVGPDRWTELEAIYARSARASPRAPIVWLSMEPGDDHLANMQLSVRLSPREPERHLAWCGDHGPPVRWE